MQPRLSGNTLAHNQRRQGAKRSQMHDLVPATSEKAAARIMSAIGTKRTFRCRAAKSAFDPKRTNSATNSNAILEISAHLTHAADFAHLLPHFVGSFHSG